MLCSDALQVQERLQALGDRPADYSGPAEEMEFSGNDPLQITWENRSDEFFVPVKASIICPTMLISR